MLAVILSGEGKDAFGLGLLLEVGGKQLERSSALIVSSICPSSFIWDEVLQSFLQSHL